MRIQSLFIVLSFLLATQWGWAQVANSSMEVMDYREVDGKIVVEGTLNGKPALFALDLSGHNAVREECLAEYGIDSTKKGQFPYTSYVCRDYTPVGSVTVDNVSIGNLASGIGSNFFVVCDAAYLKKLGVVGTIDATMFQTNVLTIDVNRKKLTVTAPYRPTYVKLTHRQNAQMTTGVTEFTDIFLGEQSIPMALDTWSEHVVSLRPSDFDRFSAGLQVTETDVPAVDFSGNTVKGRQVILPSVSLVQTKLTNVPVVENPGLRFSVAGLGLLKEGILSIDFQKDKIYFQPHGMVAINDAAEKAPEVKIEEGKLNSITKDYFIEHIFDYRKGGEFKSKSDRIIVIDFWATWCGPCMRLLPEMEKMAAEFKGKVLFLKVNADKEKELCSVFNIQALPTLMFIAPGKEMIRDMGASSEKYREIIESLLK